MLIISTRAAICNAAFSLLSRRRHIKKRRLKKAGFNVIINQLLYVFCKVETQVNETKLTFKRYEKKYLLSRAGYEALRERLDEHITPDVYFKSTVCSVYYDTENFELIRRSIEAPVYKEKLRLRSYGVPDDDGTVFIELKKKFEGMVYKRRLAMRAADAAAYVSGSIPPPERSQMTDEIDWFLHENAVEPRAFIACDRSAYVVRDEPELRITFDEALRWRKTELDLRLGSHGEALCPDGSVLMEIKLPDTAPMWLARMLSELRLFPTGFSKYGTCYRENILKEIFNGVNVCV